MKHWMLVLLLTAACLLALGAQAEATYQGYESLDPKPEEAITFDGASVTWNGKTFTLDENTLFLDARLDSAQIAENPYAFNDVKEALAALKSGTAEKPMLLLTAPGVYWVDDPDAEAIRDANNGPSFWGTPMGADITCDYLWFYGLNSDARNVVYAVNRGQQLGAQGNFTMFSISGVGLRSENVTFGNYCNVDLEFPLDESLSRPKRGDAITQAQLFFYTGNDGIAVNTRFISRLNLSQFAKYYYNCHLESGGHAGGGYYINCTLNMYNVNFGPAHLFNCDLYMMPYNHVWTGVDQVEWNIVDGSGNGLFMVDTRFHRGENLVNNGIKQVLAWDNVPRTWTTRAYQYNVTLDGEPYILQESITPGASIVITDDMPLAKAYKVVYEGETYYNLPNITGEDPFGVADKIRAAAVADGLPEDAYLTIPTLVTASLDVPTIRSGESEATLTYALSSHPEAAGEWSIVTADPAMAGYIAITDNGDGTAKIAGTNADEEAVNVIIEVRHSSGIEAAVELQVEPSYVEPPVFVSGPALTAPADGKVTLDYALDLGLESRVDQSVINWYRCADASGADPVAVAVSRMHVPEKEYTLTPGDVGKYMMATIQAKHNRSDLSEAITVIAEAPVQAEDVQLSGIHTNFLSMPTADQHDIIPGAWALDGFLHPECVKQPYQAADADNWLVLEGLGGALGYTGLVNGKQGARMVYQPVGESFAGMRTTVRLAPYKDAGQGFGSANNQFLEVYVKYDRDTMTGYAIRVERLTTQEIQDLGYDGSGAAVSTAVSLVSYKDGVATHLTPRVMTSAYTTECEITLEAKDGVLTGSVTSTKDGARGGDAFGYEREVHLTANYEENGFGQTGLLNTGTSNPQLGTNCNYTMVLSWDTEWDQ